jgi:hypothetical protein
MSDIASSSKDLSPEASDGDHRKNEEEMEPSSKKSPSPDAPDNDDENDLENAAQEDDTEAPPLPEETAPPFPSEEVPPLPEEEPPLPAEAPPVEDDGWEPKWDDRAQAYYFFNKFTNISQWENPRIPQATQPLPPGVASHDIVPNTTPVAKPVAGGYDPAIHGDYDPNADYAQVRETQDQPLPQHAPGTDPAAAYAATGAFNRFTGKWQNAVLAPENFNDESKSRRQMNAFFDVDAAANSHDGKSLKAERAQKKLSKQELNAFKEKRREKKEEKRRAWLRD